MKKNHLRIVLTGATGMVGEGVLSVCLQDESIDEILLLSRRPSGIVHPKVKELIHPELSDITSVADRLKGYDGCFFCLGVSSVGMEAEKYRRVTYDLTMHVANVLSSQNPGMVFCYVSGAGTDGTEKGRIRWARVKGKTENDLARLPFRAVYNFRPGILEPVPGLKNTISFYKYMGWLLPVFRWLTPNSIGTLKELGQAMISTLTVGYPKRVLEVADIRQLAALKA
ncbi:MAG: NAD-dependent epimerase/dehydratase family protein [Bacteroidota bacterium]